MTRQNTEKRNEPSKKTEMTDNDKQIDNTKIKQDNDSMTTNSSSNDSIDGERKKKYHGESTKISDKEVKEEKRITNAKSKGKTTKKKNPQNPKPAKTGKQKQTNPNKESLYFSLSHDTFLILKDQIS